MFFSFPGVLTILFLLILLPILFVFGAFQLITQGLENIGISGQAAVALLLLILAGSFFNIPLSKKKMVAEQSSILGVRMKERMRVSGLAINVGGGIVPLALALYLLVQVFFVETAVATLLMALLAFQLARITPRRGVSLPMVLPPLFAALFALILAPENPAPVAFVSGVLGVLLGADILRIPQIWRQSEPTMLIIGGAGVFDGIVLVGIISALLAGL